MYVNYAEEVFEKEEGKFPKKDYYRLSKKCLESTMADALLENVGFAIDSILEESDEDEDFYDSEDDI